jgi:hypothetical protein
MFIGRRETIRRWTDRKTHLCVDRYGHGLLISLLLIVLLSVLDAWFTIFHVENGAQEINPFMDFFIGYGYIYFFIVKYVLTALAVFIFCIYKNLLSVRIGTVSILVIYLVVFAHQVLWAFLM